MSKCINIGPVLEKKLREAGIISYTNLKEIGSKEAFLRIRIKDETACLHMLYALEGAIQGIRYPLLSQACKEDLKNYYNKLI